MIKWAFSLLKKYRELIAYGVVGVMTTVINMVVFWLFNTPLAVHYTVANIIAWVLAVVFAFFGCHALNLAAVTAAIATSGESHPDRHRRYVAGISTGVFYVIGGFLATMIVGLFAAIPPTMLTALAGVALLAPTQNSLHGTMQEGNFGPAVIEASLVTLVVSLSGVDPFGIVSAFWGLLAGIVVYAVLRRRPLRA